MLSKRYSESAERHRLRAFLALTLLTGCGAAALFLPAESLPHGRTDVSFSSAAPYYPYDETGPVLYDEGFLNGVNGVVSSQYTVVPSRYSATSYAIDLTSPGVITGTVYVGAFDADGKSLFDDGLDIELGSEVAFHGAFFEPWHAPHVTVLDNDGLVVAINQFSEIDWLTTSKGDVVHRFDSCGIAYDHWVEFEIDDGRSFKLTSNQMHTFGYQNHNYTVYIAAAVGWEYLECTDTGGYIASAIWRLPN